MNEKEVILDRIKGCLTAVALSDALNTLRDTTGKSYHNLFRNNPDYRSKPVPEQYLQYFKGRNITDKEIYVGADGNESPMHPSNMMRALIDCMYALLLWRDDLQKSGKYDDPGKYIDSAIDKSLWNYNCWTPFESRMCWSTAIAVGVLGTWLLDFSEDINRDIKVIASNPLLNLHLDDEEDENARMVLKERTQCGIFAAIIRNLIIYHRHFVKSDYLMIVRECAERNLWGDELVCNSIGNEALCDLSKMSTPGYEYLSQMLEWKKNSIEHGSDYHGRMLYGGIRCSAILGSIHGYEAFPYKNMLRYVEIMPEIEGLMSTIKMRFLD